MQRHGGPLAVLVVVVVPNLRRAHAHRLRRVGVGDGEAIGHAARDFRGVPGHRFLGDGIHDVLAFLSPVQVGEGVCPVFTGGQGRLFYLCAVRQQVYFDRRGPLAVLVVVVAPALGDGYVDLSRIIAVGDRRGAVIVDVDRRNRVAGVVVRRRQGLDHAVGHGLAALILRQVAPGLAPVVRGADVHGFHVRGRAVNRLFQRDHRHNAGALAILVVIVVPNLSGGDGGAFLGIGDRAAAGNAVCVVGGIARPARGLLDGIGDLPGRGTAGIVLVEVRKRSHPRGRLADLVLRAVQRHGFSGRLAVRKQCEHHARAAGGRRRMVDVLPGLRGADGNRSGIAVGKGHGGRAAVLFKLRHRGARAVRAGRPGRIVGAERRRLADELVAGQVVRLGDHIRAQRQVDAPGAGCAHVGQRERLDFIAGGVLHPIAARVGDGKGDQRLLRVGEAAHAVRAVQGLAHGQRAVFAHIADLQRLAMGIDAAGGIGLVLGNPEGMRGVVQLEALWRGDFRQLIFMGFGAGGRQQAPMVRIHAALNGDLSVVARGESDLTGDTVRVHPAAVDLLLQLEFRVRHRQEQIAALIFVQRDAVIGRGSAAGGGDGRRAFHGAVLSQQRGGVFKGHFAAAQDLRRVGNHHIHLIRDRKGAHHMALAVGFKIIAQVGEVAGFPLPAVVEQHKLNREQIYVQVVGHHVRQGQVFGIRSQVDTILVDGDMEFGVLAAGLHRRLVQKLLAQLAVAFIDRRIVVAQRRSDRIAQGDAAARARGHAVQRVVLGIQRQVIGRAIVGVERAVVVRQLGKRRREGIAADGGRNLDIAGMLRLAAARGILHPPGGHAGAIVGVRDARQVLQRRVEGIGQRERQVVDALHVHRVSKYVAIFAVVFAAGHQRARLVVIHDGLFDARFRGDVDPGGGLELRLALAEAGDVLVLSVLLGGGDGQPILVVVRRHRHHNVAGLAVLGRQEALVRALAVGAVEEQRAMVVEKLILAAFFGIQALYVRRGDGVHRIREFAGGGGVSAGHVIHQMRVFADEALGRHGQRDLPHGLFIVEAQHPLGQLERAVAHRGHLFRHALLRFDHALVFIHTGVVHPEGQRLIRHIRQRGVLQVVLQRECKPVLS